MVLIPQPPRFFPFLKVYFHVADPQRQTGITVGLERAIHNYGYTCSTEHFVDPIAVLKTIYSAGVPILATIEFPISIIDRFDEGFCEYRVRLDIEGGVEAGDWIGLLLQNSIIETSPLLKSGVINNGSKHQLQITVGLGSYLATVLE